MTETIKPVRPFGQRGAAHRIIIDRGSSVSHVTLPSWGLKALSAASGLVLLWAVSTTAYLISGTVFPTDPQKKHAEVTSAYEDHIDALRAQVEELKTRSIVERSTLEDKVEAILKRQATLETKAGMIQSLDAMADTIGLRDSQEPLDGEDEVPVADEPSQAPTDAITITTTDGKQASLGGLGFLAPAKDRNALEARLAQVESAIAAMEARQGEDIAQLGVAIRTKADEIRSVLADLGVDVARLGSADDGKATGGPFIPYTAGTALSFDDQAEAVRSAIAEVETLKRAVETVPLRRPFKSAAITSGFGYRRDPFLGAAAMHAGVDFRQDYGAPVRATAGGTVTEASFVGGYGNMVEIDHGNGLSTRFGHLASIAVAIGDRVEIGSMLGTVGSTGRSTGPHLHYETRVDGRPVDPMRFLRAGRRIGV